MQSSSQGDTTSTTQATTGAPTVLDIAVYFLRLGTLGFGRPVALANFMRTDLTDKRHWLTQREYISQSCESTSEKREVNGASSSGDV
jgi:chromate transporter